MPSLNIFESEMLLCSIDYFHQVSATSSARSRSRLPSGQSPSIPWDLLCCSVGSLPALKVLWRRHICLQWESRTSKVGTWTWQWYLVCSSITPAFPVYPNVDEKVLFEFHQRYAFWIPICEQMRFTNTSTLTNCKTCDDLQLPFSPSS